MPNSESLEYLNQARTFVGVEKFQEALEYINKAIQVDKLNKELYVEKSIILANLSQYDEAIEALQKALKIDKSYAEAYFHYGNICLLKGDETLGIENFNKAIAYGFDDAQIYFNLGLLYEEMDQPDIAIRNYSKAILKDPLRVDARVRKAQVFIENGQREEALETLNELILADPDLYEGYHLKALLLADMGRFEEGQETLDEATRLFPKDPAFVLDQVNLFVLNNQLDQAKDLIKKLEEEYELDLTQKRQLELEKARIYAIEVDLDSVIDSLSKAKEYSKSADPTDIDPEATFLLVNSYLEKKEYEKAIEGSKELLQCEVPAYVMPSYYTLPYAYKKLGQEEKAKAQFEDSIRELRSMTLENPELADGYFFRALCLKEIGKYDKALELSDYLLKVDGESSVLHSLKAEILYAMGDEAGAKSEIAKSKSVESEPAK